MVKADKEYTTFHLRIRETHLAKLHKRAASREATVTDEIREAVRKHLGEAGA